MWPACYISREYELSLSAARLGIATAAIALLLLVPRSSYQPGPLLAAHHQLATDCASCHRPWRGPWNGGCINCHGDISNNPHDGVDVSQADVGLLPGRRLAASSSNSLECLSCHTEHRGAAPDISATSAFACTWCHKHPAIDKVAEHQAAVMQREFFVRHIFKQRFNHYEHDLLITSHYPPIAGGFRCTSCHLVPPVPPGGREQMSLKWTGCAGAGCHLVPQDSFMEMPAALGPSPATIPYSGVIPIRHIKAVFVHSAGHLESACEQCHFEVARSRNPDDRASLAILRCFNCHAHQPAPSAPDARRTALVQRRALIQAEAIAAAPLAKGMSPVPADGQSRTVVACNECHLFHAYGVVPLLDFTHRAPEFPPNQARHFELTVYVPHWARNRSTARLGPVALRPIVFSPWW